MDPYERRNQDETKLRLERELDEGRRFAEALHELRLAALRGHLEGVKAVLASGMSVNQTLKGGWTALMYACSMAHPTIVDYLLQQGANPNFHKELFTPLMATCASCQGDEDKLVQCVDLLLHHKASVNVAERHHISPLMFAAKEGHAKVVARLLTNSCNCDVDARDGQGWTALFWAVNQGKENVVEILVGKGAKTDLRDRCGQTVVDLARNKGSQKIIDILAKKNIQTIDVWPENNNHKLSIIEEKYVIGKKTDSLLQTFLGELSASVNNRCGSNFTRFLNSMELENNLEILKAHGQVISKIANSVNGCLQNSLSSANKTKSMEITRKNFPYSAVEAKEVLSHTVRHLEGLYASISYVRLHMQGNPPAALVEDKYARISDITALSQMALQSSRILYDEIRFFHQYAKQLEESDCTVPADFIIEQKTDRHHTSRRIVSSCIVVTAVLVILYNSRFFTFSVFSK